MYVILETPPVGPLYIGRCSYEASLPPRSPKLVLGVVVSVIVRIHCRKEVAAGLPHAHSSIAYDFFSDVYVWATGRLLYTDECCCVMSGNGRVSDHMPGFSVLLCSCS